MKKLSILLIAILFCSLQGHAQFWISFGWNEPHCQNCLWMEQAIRMTNRQAAEYHKIIHRYGEKIEREARKHYRYWDQSARKIYKLRMERDRKLQRILSPSQFRLYIPIGNANNDLHNDGTHWTDGSADNADYCTNLSSHGCVSLPHGRNAHTNETAKAKSPA